MPVVPNFIERLVFFKLNAAPAPSLDLVTAGTFKAVATALNLGVFDALSKQPSTAADIAVRIKADERAVTVLLDLLTASRYLRKNNRRYECTSMTAKWILRDSPVSFAPFFTFFNNFVFPFWDTHIEESIHSGQLSTTLYDSLDQIPGGWKTAQECFIAIANAVGDELVLKARLPSSSRRLLDLGGGHGLYAVKFCHSNPALTATIFDRPEPAAVARQTVTSEKMENRISVVAGDYWRDDIGTGYDSVLLFNIIHANKPDKNIELFKKVADVLNPGGQVIILEQFSEPTSSNAVGALVQFLSITFLAAVGGQTYEYDDVVKWLSASGFSEAQRKKLRRAPGSSLVIARKAA